MNDILAFLGSLHQKGLQYSAFQTARSAVSNFVKLCGGIDFRDDFLIKKFMQGIFNLKPSLPKYNSVWDVQIVLGYIKSMNNLTLLDLSSKLCMLFLLVTAQRCQTLHLIEVGDLEFTKDACLVRFKHKLKQSRPGHHLEDIMLQSVVQPELCIVKTLNEYLTRTSGLRGEGHKLLISTQKPHHGVSKDTVSRWVKSLMIKAGLDSRFGVHSTRAVATSTAVRKGVPIASIIKTAGWSNATTFQKFYHKNIATSPEPSFQTAVLEKP